MDRDEAFPAWLAAAMRSRGLSQAQLARTMGVREAQVSRWRRGLAVPTVQSLQRLAEALGVSRATLEQLAGYPADGPEAADGRSRSPEMAGALHAYQSVLGSLLEQRVPPELWPAYVSACTALADALEESYAGTLRRADRLLERRARAPAGSTTRSDPARLPSVRELGFRGPAEPAAPDGARSGESHGHPDGGRIDQPR